MWTASKIRRFVYALPKGQLFASMELVSLGPRTIVDRTTWLMVARGDIIRLARGVFVRNDGGLKIPSAEEVAAYKAKVFAKRLVMHGETIAAKLGLCESEPDKTIFATNGCTSSFIYMNDMRRVFFHGLSPRKVNLGNTSVGLVIRGLWHLTKEGISRHAVNKATRRLGRNERELLQRLARFMPGWLAAQFPWGRPDKLRAAKPCFGLST